MQIEIEIKKLNALKCWKLKLQKIKMQKTKVHYLKSKKSNLQEH